MFPLEFPLRALADARPEDWVLDPFCGRGTTLFAARKLGLGAVGIDSNAVATAIAAAKLVSPRPAAVVRRARELIASDEVEMPSGRFWDLAYHEKTPSGYRLLSRRGLSTAGLFVTQSDW